MASSGGSRFRAGCWNPSRGRSHAALGRFHAARRSGEAARRVFGARRAIVERVKAGLERPELRASLERSPLVRQIYGEAGDPG